MSGIVLFNSLAGTVSGAASVDVADPLAASFSTGATSVTLTDVKLDLYFDSSFGGSPTGMLTVSIDADTSTTPGATVETLETIEHSALPASAGIVDVNGFTPVVLAANTRYWIDLSDSDIGVQWEQTSQTTGSGVAGEYVGSVDSVTSNSASAQMMEVTAACYAAGTRILTARGEVAIESLRAGDVVPTVSGAGPQPVRWIGRRRIDCSRHPDPARVWPVRVRAGAFGDAQPACDLWLSPDHAVYLWGKLIPIRCLINNATVAQEQLDSVTYYHVELPVHAAILAEGLPAESYLDVGNRAAFENGGAAIVMHADFATRVWAENACAEQILGGPILDAACARLSVQASMLCNQENVFRSLPQETGSSRA